MSLHLIVVPVHFYSQKLLIMKWSVMLLSLTSISSLSMPVAALPALEWSLPSSTEQYELRIEVQPRQHHRAHYETEGSRGAVKASTGGHPVVQVIRGQRCAFRRKVKAVGGRKVGFVWFCKEAWGANITILKNRCVKMCQNVCERDWKCVGETEMAVSEELDNRNKREIERER